MQVGRLSPPRVAAVRIVSLSAGLGLPRPRTNTHSTPKVQTTAEHRSRYQEAFHKGFPGACLGQSSVTVGV